LELARHEYTRFRRVTTKAANADVKAAKVE
jgi:hypothetical protein